jgi:flagellar hook assembly protein FlgD
VSFRLDREREVRMRIYNVRGELVRTVQDGRLPAGFAVLDWDGRDRAGKRVSSGVYFYRVEIDGENLTRKLVRMR